MADPDRIVKKVRDPIHDYILLDAGVLGIVNTPRYQRLRRIHQLGTAMLVYPGAHHTRFEHGLGAMHLARTAAEALDLDADAARDLRYAALLHDVGHGPFSHASDHVLHRHLGVSHVDVSREVVTGVLADTVREAGGDPQRVADLIGGKGDLGDLTAGDIDVDRMDYLVRDSHYTGVDIGVDLYRIVTELERTPQGLALRRGAVAAAEMLLATRSAMYATVYYHPTCRASESMLERAMELAVAAGELTVADFPTLDDVDVTMRLRTSSTPAARFIRAIEERRLLKLALDFTMAELPEGALDRLRDDGLFREAEATIAESVGVDPVDVIVDAPPPPRFPEVDARVVTRNGVVPLRERSALVASLPAARLDHWRLRVFVPEDVREAAAAPARDAVPAAFA